MISYKIVLKHEQEKWKELLKKVINVFLKVEIGWSIIGSNIQYHWW